MKTLKVIFSIVLIGLIKYSSAQDNNAPLPSPQPAPAPQNIYPETEDKPAPGFFAMGFGFIQPIGPFSMEPINAYKGYALPGGDFNFSANLPIAHSNFGLALMYNYSSNAFDINNYVNNIQMSDENRNYVPLLQDAYTENFFLGGLFATIPVQSISFDFRAMAGPAACNLPEVVYSAESTSPTATQNFVWHTAGSTSTSFATDAGAAIRYRMGLFSLMGGIDYLWADPMVSTTQRYTDQFGNVTYSHVGGKVPIDLLSYSLGLGFQIW